MKRIAMLSALLLIFALPLTAPAGEEATAPDTAPDPHLAAMQALPDLVGTWEGEGWMRRGPGEPSTFHSKEIVESRLDGRAWIVEGIHTAKDSGELTHHALALLSWDAEAERYDFRTFVAGRGGGNFTGHVEDGAFVWEMETPDGGHIRYTIRVETGNWTEVGEYSPDGETWNQFFGMDLQPAD